MKTWDIFCKVIDNYGDIGVCWRFARQLAAEYPFKVRLWVDDLRALNQLWPEATLKNQQTIEHVEIQHWQGAMHKEVAVADVVVEAFACEIPASYLEGMIQKKQQGSPPAWFNLEYLSAEHWVDDYHKLPSIHPQSGLKKIFFFPGFTQKTAGLLCEQHLLETQKKFLLGPEKNIFLQQFPIPVDALKNTLLVSLFSYENAALPSLIQAWSQSATAICCFVTPGKTLANLNKYLSHNQGLRLKVGDIYTLNQLTLAAIPFLSQTDYDR